MKTNRPRNHHCTSEVNTTRASICFVATSLLFAAAMVSPMYAQAILFPWRPAPTVAHPGDRFQIKFHAEENEQINHVMLRGSFHDIKIPADSIETTRGEFDYDVTLDVNYSMKINVTVPNGTPADMYDLVIQTDHRTVVSQHSVNVVNRFRKRYTIVHISDTHMGRNWTGDLATGHPPELEHLEKIAEVANLIGVDMVALTGDDIMPGNRNPDQAEPSIERKWEVLYQGAGGIKGLNAFNAPTFVIAGNHDGSHGIPKSEKAADYIKYNGLRTFAASYGTARILAYDDSLGYHNNPRDMHLQLETFRAFLKEAGPGEMRIMLHHHPLDWRHRKFALDFLFEFLDEYEIQLSLDGSAHRNREKQIGTTPTLELTTANAGIIDKDPGWLRILTIEGDKVLLNKATQYGDIVKKTAHIRLNYDEANDGSATANEATITNDFDVPFDSCRVRFVMKRGKYRVSGGEVEQFFNAGEVTVYDMRVAAPAHGKATVTIMK